MGEVIYGIDFAKRREDHQKAVFDSVMRELILILDQAGGQLIVTDTAPCEYVVPPDDCA